MNRISEYNQLHKSSASSKASLAKKDNKKEPKLDQPIISEENKPKGLLKNVISFRYDFDMQKFSNNQIKMNEKQNKADLKNIGLTSLKKIRKNELIANAFSFLDCTNCERSFEMAPKIMHT